LNHTSVKHALALMYHFVYLAKSQDSAHLKGIFINSLQKVINAQPHLLQTKLKNTIWTWHKCKYCWNKTSVPFPIK